MCSIKFASVRLAFPIYSWVSVSGIIKDFYDFFFTKCCIHTPMLIQIGKFYRILSWKLLTCITYRLYFFIWDIFIFLMRPKSEKVWKSVWKNLVWLFVTVIFSVVWTCTAYRLWLTVSLVFEYTKTLCNSCATWRAHLKCSHSHYLSWYYPNLKPRDNKIYPLQAFVKLLNIC